MSNSITDNLDELSNNYYDNLDRIKREFHYPLNNDLKFRELYIKSVNREGTLLFLKGITDVNQVEINVVKPIIENKLTEIISEDIANTLIKKIILGSTVKKVKLIIDVIEEITFGNTVLIINGINEALSINSSSFQHRAVEKPTIENILKGPKESFTESSEINRSLVRKHLKNKDLISEITPIGKRGSSDIHLMYIEGIVNPELLQEVKTRINKIEVDSIEETPILEQYIEDRPYSLIPSSLTTERPDRVVSFLKEGHVAIFTDHGAVALIVPITFFTLFHTSEDMYQRWAFGNFIRLIRLVSCITALIMPGIYMAVTTFHTEMLPADLVMATVAAREKLPFPAFIEILIMEVAFELIREAGVRIPTAVGPTIGIVGTLILGQAAVEANIVSPVLVIVISITGLSSFAIPEMNLSYVIRIGRFLFLAVAAISGFYGIAMLITVVASYMSTIESFGVPFFSPYTPYFPSSKDTVARPSIWKLTLRPFHNRTVDKVRARDGSDK